MSRVIKTGQQVTNGGGVVVLKGGEGGMRKLRCPKCGGLATSANTAGGKPVFRCQSCTAEFSSRPM